MARARVGRAVAVTLGVVRALCRYPVKSMRGECLERVDVDAHGMAGDRRRAVLDVVTGRIASAKYPRLWRRLLAARAYTSDAGGVRIDLPDATVDSDSDEADDLLTALLGRDVRLIDTPPAVAELDRAVPEYVLEQGPDVDVPKTVSRLGTAAPAGTFFDYAPIHLVTTATLNRIGDLSARGLIEADRYRPNLVLDTPDLAGFPENGWVGRCLRLGSDVVLRVLVPTPRCAVPTLPHGDLPADPEALRVLARHNRVEVGDVGRLPVAGVYAEVLAPGPIRCGDRVRFA